MSTSRSSQDASRGSTCTIAPGLGDGWEGLARLDVSGKRAARRPFQAGQESKSAPGEVWDGGYIGV